MAGLNIRKFLGIAPKVSPELLPDTSAQIAYNAKLYSGDLIPQPDSIIAGDTGRPTGTLTLYGIRAPDSDELTWLSWDKQVDVAVVTTEKGGEFRFFYTGDGPPKVSSYLLATNGPKPYPNDYYYMGLPLPKTELTTTVAPFTTVAITNYTRDANGVVTLNTTVPHNLRDKAVITVTGFTYLTGSYTTGAGNTVFGTINNHGLSGTPTIPLTFVSGKAVSGPYDVTITGANTFTAIDPSNPDTGGNLQMSMASFNATSVPATVKDADTITYQSFGFEMAVRSTNAAGVRIRLGGPDIPRTYVYTWYNQWDEESIGSDPSELIYVKEGDVVTVGNIPSSFTDPNYAVDGVRLYRSSGSASASDYLLLKTLWFPKQPISYKRTGGVATIGFARRHFLIEDDRFRLTGMINASFNVTDGVVTDVPDANHISYLSPGPDVNFTAQAAGTFYYDVAEELDDPPRYWGYAGNYDFIDDFDPLNLTEVLASDNYEQPPDNLEGLITAQNGILAGFVDNTVYFSVPYKPGAWPSEYAVTLDYEVVALALMSGAIIVLTTGYPFIISGTDPAVLSVRRIDALYPCLNRQGVVSMNYGVVYPTHDGLGVLSTQLSAQLATKVLFNNDTWHEKLDPTEIVAEFYGDAYVASWSGGSFTFEPVAGEQVPPYFVDNAHIFSAPWYDPITGNLYQAKIDSSSVFEWDPAGGAPMVVQWKSKVFKTPNMVNIGAARVIADYPDPPITTLSWEDIDLTWEAFNSAWYTVSQSVEFTLFADKRPIATVQVENDEIFRLPSGYRTDTFEVAVKADIRIRSIHLAETPFALRQV